MLTFCFILGIFDGCFITMLGPIAFDLCGGEGAGQAIGFLLALCSIPLTIGPPVAGFIYDHVGNYIPAFLAAGVPPIVGALVMFSIRCIHSGTALKLELFIKYQALKIFVADTSDKNENHSVPCDTKQEKETA